MTPVSEYQNAMGASPRVSTTRNQATEATEMYLLSPRLQHQLIFLHTPPGRTMQRVGGQMSAGLPITWPDPPR